MKVFDGSHLSPEEQAELDRLLRQIGDDPQLAWHAGMTPYQREAWRVILQERHPMTLLQWGRGTGKTKFGAQVVRELCDKYSGLEIILAAPTISDIRDVMVKGSSGLASVFPEGAVEFITSQNRVNLPNDNYALVIPAESPERYRGKNASFAWFDELGSARKIDAYTNLKLALRAAFPDGSAPQLLITTTPQPSTLMKSVVENPLVRAFYAATTDNHYLHPDVLAGYVAEFGGTTLGRQELFGELLDEVAGALWTIEQIEAASLKAYPSVAMKYVAIGVDPAGDGDDSDLTGVVTVGLGEDDCYYVLRDDTARYSPQQLHDKLCELYEDESLGVDGMYVESNYGGTFLRQCLPQHIPTELKASTKKKHVRAMPVQQIHEKGLAKHAPGLSELEKQMYTWSPLDRSARSPDRVDAMTNAYQWLLARNRRKSRIWCGPIAA